MLEARTVEPPTPHNSIFKSPMQMYSDIEGTDISLPAARSSKHSRERSAEIRESINRLSNSPCSIPSVMSKVLKYAGIALTVAGIAILIPIAFHLPYNIFHILWSAGGVFKNPLTLELLQKILISISGDLSLLLGSLTLIASGGVLGKASKWVLDTENNDNVIGTDALAVLITTGAAALLALFGKS